MDKKVTLESIKASLDSLKCVPPPGTSVAAASAPAPNGKPKPPATPPTDPHLDDLKDPMWKEIDPNAPQPWSVDPFWTHERLHRSAEIAKAARRNNRVLPIMWRFLSALGRISRVYMTTSQRNSLEDAVMAAFTSRPYMEGWIRLLEGLPSGAPVPSPNRISPLIALHAAVTHLLRKAD